MIYIWYTHDIYIWYTYDTYIWYTYDNNIWYTCDIYIYIWFTYDIHNIHSIYIYYMYILCIDYIRTIAVLYIYIWGPEQSGEGQLPHVACSGASPDAGQDATCSACLLGGLAWPGTRCHMFSLLAWGPYDDDGHRISYIGYM